MHLLAKYHRNAITVNQNVKKEYERLYMESLLLPSLLLQTSSDTMTLTLLNSRLLRKHSDDILSDVNLISNELLCFAETQLHLHKNTSETISFKATIECLLISKEISIKVLYLSIPVACFFKIVQAMVVYQFFCPRNSHF